MILLLAAVAIYAVLRDNRAQTSQSITAYPLSQDTKDALLRTLDTLHADPGKYLELEYFTSTEAGETEIKFEKDIRTDKYYGLLTVLIYPQSPIEESTLTHMLNGEYLYSQTEDKTNPHFWSFRYFDGQNYVNIDLYGQDKTTNIAEAELSELIQVIQNN